MRPKVVDREVVVELDLDERHLQALGTAQGGTIASVLDSAIALNKQKACRGKESRHNRLAQCPLLEVRLQGEGRGVGRPIRVGTKTVIGYGED
jgi:acyl-coenzyme A thioesterase PaaI-like protein